MSKKMTPGIIASLIFVLASCSHRDQFTVEGNLSHTSSKKVYLAEIQGSQAIPVDTAVLSGDGKFVFHQKVSAPKVLEVLAEGFTMDVVAENGKSVFIQADLKDTAMNYTVYGSQENKRLQEFVKLRQRAAKSVDKLVLKLKAARTAGDTAGIYQENSQVEYSLESNIRKFTRKYKQDFVSLYTINYLSADKDFLLYQEVAAAAGQKFKGNALADTLQAFIKREQPTAIGQSAAPINLPAPDGSFHSLQELKGKYVMIDFWASWCGPCRRESPFNVALYKQFKNKGFEIFGVSLDRDHAEWVKAIADDRLEWRQVSELKEWHSAVVGDYNFQGIPYNVILDRQGKIIAKNLHGPELAAFLQKLLP